MKLSFGMIFSIILIIIFLAIAFIAIQTLLSFKDQAMIGKFFDALDSDVIKASNSQAFSGVPKTYFLPTSIEYLCFMDFTKNKNEVQATNGFYDDFKFISSEDNVFLYPTDAGGDLGSKNIPKLDIDKTTFQSNPFCIKNIDGKINLNLNKESGQNLVTIKK